jgi:transposase
LVKYSSLEEEYFMTKREYKTGIELTDEQWVVLEPLLPEPERSPRGGQVPAPNRVCLEGVLWLLRSGARYKDIPKHFPSGSTCWRRLALWYEQDLLIDIWQKLLGMLDEQSLLEWEECFADGTFSPAKKGAKVSARPNAAREQNLWWLRMGKAFRSVYFSRRPRPTK